MLASSAPAAVANNLYPNPAHGTVALAQAPAATPATLYDATGRVCLRTTVRADKTIDISSLPSGLYLARVGTAVHRLVVE